MLYIFSNERGVELVIIGLPHTPAPCTLGYAGSFVFRHRLEKCITLDESEGNRERIQMVRRV